MCLHPHYFVMQYLNTSGTTETDPCIPNVMLGRSEMEESDGWSHTSLTWLWWVWDARALQPRAWSASRSWGSARRHDRSRRHCVVTGTCPSTVSWTKSWTHGRTDCPPARCCCPPATGPRTRTVSESPEETVRSPSNNNHITNSSPNTSNMQLCIAINILDFQIQLFPYFNSHKQWVRCLIQ